MPPFFIAVSQSNPVLGDIEGNARLIFEAAKQASQAGAKLLVTPELSLTAYPPEDLLLRDSFITAVDARLKSLAAELAVFKDLRVIVGHPYRADVGLQNQASVLYQGKVLASYAKQHLPNHEVFDEVHHLVKPVNVHPDILDFPPFVSLISLCRFPGRGILFLCASFGCF